VGLTKMIDEGDVFLQEVVVDGATRFGQFDVDKQLKPHHKYLILWIATERRNVDLIQRLCLSGPSFPLIYKFDPIPHKSYYSIDDIISATSDEEILRIAVWKDEYIRMASRIFEVLREEQLKESMMKKLREELAQLPVLDYAYQMSRYVMERLSQDVLEGVQRPDIEEVIFELMSSHMNDVNVLEFVKASVAAILILVMGKRPLIQDKIIEGIKGLPLESHHKQLIVYTVLHTKNYAFLRHLFLENLDLPLIYVYDEEPTTLFPGLGKLFPIHDDGGMKIFIVNLSRSYAGEIRSLFKECRDKQLRDKLFVKMLAELSQLSSRTFAYGLSEYMDLDTLTILKEIFDFNVLTEHERSLFSSQLRMRRDPEAVQKAIPTLLKAIKPQV
jgi:hypothetical protein